MCNFTKILKLYFSTIVKKYNCTAWGTVFFSSKKNIEHDFEHCASVWVERKFEIQTGTYRVDARP